MKPMPSADGATQAYVRGPFVVEGMIQGALGGALSVPTTAIYTKADGIVNWRTSVLQENDRSENIEILFASHSGLGVNPAVLWAIADRLRIPEGEFEPFSKDGPFSSSYAKADRMNREQGCPGEQGR